MSGCIPELHLLFRFYPTVLLATYHIIDVLYSLLYRQVIDVTNFEILVENENQVES